MGNSDKFQHSISLAQQLEQKMNRNMEFYVWS
jgi:hypothetical protein